MLTGGRIGAYRVEAVLAPTLVRARGRSGPVLVRLGRRDRLGEALTVCDRLGQSASSVELEDGRVGLVLPDEDRQGLLELATPFDEVRIRRVFRQLARRIGRLHEQGLLLGGLDPEGLRVGADLQLVPLLREHRAWQAPEGSRTREADWYVFGHLLYVALTGETFEEHGRGNGPDPRDRRAAAPDDLASLAMDLLLLDASERCDGAEVLEALEAGEDDPTADEDLWLEEALRRGGVVFRDPPEGVEALRAGLGEALVSLDDLDALLPRIDAAEALTPAQRGLVVAVLRQPAAQMNSTVERAGALLGLALTSAGVRLCWTAQVVPGLVVGLARSDVAPVVVVDGPSPALQQVLAAEGAAVGPPLQLEPRAADGCPTDPTVLAALGAPVGTSWLRAGWERLPLFGAPGDQVLDRQVLRVGLGALWVDPGRAAVLGAWLQRRAGRRGDGPGLAGASLLLEWFQDEPVERGTERDLGVAWRRLGRALRHRRHGRMPQIEVELAGALPLPEAGDAENALGRLLVAEALIQRGRLRRAGRLLRQVRVDAVRWDLPHVDLAARSLAVRCGRVDALEPSDPSPDGLLGGWVARARSEAALWHGRLDLAVEQAERAEGLATRWPRRTEDPIGVEAATWTRRCRMARGEEPPGSVGSHPLAPCWTALETAVEARRRGDAQALDRCLAEASHRAEGAGADLLALATSRVRGLHLGGVRGGTLVESADQRLERAGVPSIPRMLRLLVPELVFALRPGPA